MKRPKPLDTPAAFARAVERVLAFAGLPTLAEIRATRRAVPKHRIPTRKAVKAKATRTARAVVLDIRSQCVFRDGYCRARMTLTKNYGDKVAGDIFMHVCQGPSEWAHLGEKKRAKTEGQAPDVRHTTAGSLMLCQVLHDRYDGRARPRIEIEALTDRGADRPLRFKLKGSK